MKSKQPDTVTVTIEGNAAITATFTSATEPEPDLAIAKAVTPASDVDLGDTVTYTLTLTNNGEATATGVALTDELPAGVVFDAFVENARGATEADGVISWSGDLTTGETLVVVLTATVEDDPALYNSTITNVAGFTSDNARSGSAEAAFTVVTRYRILLPIIAHRAGVMP